MVLLPDTRLVPCPACSELFHAGAARCPHCDAVLSEGPGRLCTAALLWTSLSLSGCLVTAVYGVPTSTDTVSTSDSTGASSSTGSTGGTGTGTGTTTPPTTGMTGTMGTDSDATTGQTDTGSGTDASTGSTSGMTDGTGTMGSSGDPSNPEPLYGAALDPESP